MNKLLFFIIIFFFIGCDDIRKYECICTTEFRMITVEIVDSLNRPLDNLQTKTVDIKNNEIIPSYRKREYMPNIYVIADDSNVKNFLTKPTSVIFYVSDSVKTKSYRYSLKTDECYCHIYKTEGPSIIIF